MPLAPDRAAAPVGRASWCTCSMTICILPPHLTTAYQIGWLCKRGYFCFGSRRPLPCSPTQESLPPASQPRRYICPILRPQFPAGRYLKRATSAGRSPACPRPPLKAAGLRPVSPQASCGQPMASRRLLLWFVAVVLRQALRQDPGCWGHCPPTPPPVPSVPTCTRSRLVGWHVFHRRAFERHSL